MRQYERYLFAHLLLPALLVTVALTAIIWLTQMMRFISYIMNRGLTIGDFLYLTGLMLPNLLLIMIPISLGIAVIYAYNRLTSDSELVVFNAVGVSKLQLARPVFLIGAMAMVVCYVLSLWVLPLSNKKFNDVKTLFRDKYASVLLEEQVFNTPVDGITVFVRERDTDGILHGILLHDNRNIYAPVTMLAERGRLEQSPSGPRFYLEQGVRQQIENGHIGWLSFDNYTLDIAFFSKDSEEDRDPNRMFLTDLLKGDPDPKFNRAMKSEIHQRLGWPLMTLVLPVLALGILSAGEFNRRGQWKRIMQAAVGMIATLLFFFILRSMSVKHNNLSILLYLLCLFGFSTGIQLLANGRLWWPRRTRPSPHAMEATP